MHLSTSSNIKGKNGNIQPKVNSIANPQKKKKKRKLN